MVNDLMNGWVLLDDNTASAQWNHWMSKLGRNCLYQTYEWGSYKQRSGQPQLRLGFFTGPDNPQIVLQGHLKRVFGGLGVLWVPGGPTGDLELLNQDGLQAIARIFGVRHLLIRSSLMSERNAKDVTALRRLGHRESKRKINSGLSMWLSIPPELGEVLPAASSNWKHNLRRGQKRAHVERIEKIDAAEIARTYRTLQEAKGIGDQFSEAAIRSMIAEFGDRLIAYGSRDAQGKLVAVRACICIGSTGWDIWAASTEEARRNYASHVLLENLIKACQQHGMTAYDLSGIDPQKAVGVYNFKKGTGARHVEYLGEWDLGPRWLGRMLDTYLSVR